MLRNIAGSLICCLLAIQVSANGSFQIASPSQAVVGNQVTLSIAYLPDENIEAGGMIQVARHWFHNIRLQNTSSDLDNYVTIESGDQTLKWISETDARIGPHGGLNAPVDLPVFRLAEGQVSAGTQLIITVENLHLPVASEPEFALPLYVRSAAGDPWVQIEGNTIPLQAGRLSNLVVEASSRLTPGEEADVSLRLEDRHGNLAAGRALTLDMLINGRYERQIQISEPQQQISGISFVQAGQYRLEFRSGGGGLRGQSNVISVGDHDYRLEWVDLSDYAAEETQSSQAMVVRYNRNVAEGGQSLKVSLGADEFYVAQPEVPTDVRSLTPTSLRQVQVVAAESIHLWLADDILRRGYDVGFVGLNESKQFPRPHRKVYTAVEVDFDEDWVTAMLAGRSYVSVGSKVDIRTLTRNLTVSNPVEISAAITAGHAIKEIQLFKNGEVIAVSQGETIESDRVEFTFYSDSRPAGNVMSLPRNQREWLGYISSRSVSLELAETADSDVQTRLGANGRRVDFLTSTHGFNRSILVAMPEVNIDSVLELVLAGGYEDAAWIPDDRLPAEIPSQRFVIPYAEISDGAVRLIETDGYADRVVVSPERTALGQSYLFEYEDPVPPKRGDFYYKVIKLVNGDYAISRPIRVE